ncbi:MAG: Crp/Fnr family transcriptional regulator [Xanthobacteraceae bacterium]
MGSFAAAPSNKKKKTAFDPKTFLAQIGEGRTIVKHHHNQAIYTQGDNADSVFHILEGKIKVTVISKTGKEAVLAILGPGEFFGEGCLNGHTRRMATVTALTDCTVMRITKATMLRALRDEPELAAVFIMYLLHRNYRVEEDLVDHLFNSSEKRLARILLLLANFGKEKQSERVAAPVSQETLAEMVGTTRSRVNFFMNKFRRLGFIDYNGGGIEIHGSLLNMVLHD